MSARDLIFEIGTEELPSTPLNDALVQLEKLVPNAFAQANLDFDDFTLYSTPRRITICVSGLKDEQPDRVDEYKGPAKKVGYAPDGEPTKAGLGFARGKGIDISQVELREIDGAEYLYARVEQEGRAALDILPDILSGFLHDLDWKRSQRWGDQTVRFVRPVRWLLALFGDEIVPVTFGDVVSDRFTYGHRFLSSGTIEISSMKDYENTLRKSHVVVDPSKRKTLIEEGIAELGSRYGTPLVVESVLREVINLTEYPNAIVGEFDEEFLRVPREILEYAMSKHQRYFAIQRADGTLDNHFVVISNGNPKFSRQIIEGHERVVRARLADAAFFYDEDLKVPLEQWLKKLEHVVFQEKLGTTAAKVERVEELTRMLSRSLDVEPDEAAFAQRAAHLAKADLVTNAVVEFTELQGIMGAYYALAAGEESQVATAIREHYKPRFASDAIPSTVAGKIVSIADKLDTIAGIFAVGKAPKGTSDPFALRRSAIGILQIALQSLPLDLEEAVTFSLGRIKDVSFDEEKTRKAIIDFFTARLQTILRDAGFAYDTVDAVLAVDGGYPADAYRRCESLTEFRAVNEAAADLLAAFKRAKNLSVPSVGVQVDRSLFMPVEDAFASAIVEAAQGSKALFAAGDYAAMLALLSSLREPVDAFFEGVMIMDPDEALKNNRIALLNNFLELFDLFADFSRLS